MLTIPPNTSKLMISGLTQEIARLNAIGETCDDEWPIDFDPNDAMVYDSFRQELERNAVRNTIIDLKNYSKVDAFSMALLPGFVIKNLSELSLADIESACRIYACTICSASMYRNARDR